MASLLGFSFAGKAADIQTYENFSGHCVRRKGEQVVLYFIVFRLMGLMGDYRFVVVNVIIITFNYRTTFRNVLFVKAASNDFWMGL